MTSTADRCAYPACQAGGVILPGAPRMPAVVGTAVAIFHPGCFDAQRGGTVMPVNEHAWHAEDDR